MNAYPLAASELPRTNGLLYLQFSHTASPLPRTKLLIKQQQPPLRVIRAFPRKEGDVLVHLHNVSGGILGGDQLVVRAELAANTRVQLTSTGATRLYRHRPGYADAAQLTVLTVGKDALLEYLPDPLIPFAASRFHQQTQIELAEGAGLFYWEILAPGRAAYNEQFAYDQIILQLDITTDGQPILLERLQLQPALRPLHSMARMAAYHYVGALYICKVGLTADVWLEVEQALMAMADSMSIPGEILWGVSTMPAHGLTIRALGMTNRAIADGLVHFWRTAKETLYGMAAVPPRKVY